MTDSSSSETEEEVVAGKDSGYRWGMGGSGVCGDGGDDVGVGDVCGDGDF